MLDNNCVWALSVTDIVQIQ